MSLRVGIIGARQGRHGIGEHVARHLAELGARVVAVAGTTAVTAEEAAANLNERCGIAARAFVGAEAMLSEAQLDAVAICSPERYHRRHLQLALESGQHALCEKPLVFEASRDPVADALPLIAAFTARGKVLMVNEQWPYTLPYFERLTSAPLERRTELTLAMWLCPGVTGAEMVPSALPHVASMLLALAPADGSVEAIRSAWLRRDTELMIDFDYRHSAGTAQVSAVFQHVPRQPRPAAYEIDGRLVHRVIEAPGYRMFLENADSSARIAIDDPLRLLLADFLSRCQNAQTPLPQDPILGKSLSILRAVYGAVAGTT